MLLRDSSTGEYWKIEKNKKRKFLSDAIFLADYKQEDAIPVSSKLLSYYETSFPIVMANNTIVSTNASGAMYLISDGLKHRLVGQSALASLGMQLAATIPVSPVAILKEELDAMGEGEPITENSVYPKGELLKSDGSAIYYVKHGIKYILLDEAVWQENFNRKEPSYISQAALDSYQEGDPVPLSDGSLVRSSDGKFYLISNSTKKRIASPDLVKRMFNLSSVDSIPVASSALLALSEDGDPIDYIDGSVQDPSNYVSYADRQKLQTQTQTKKNPYFALLDILDVPASMAPGQSAKVNIRFRNRGDNSWQSGKIYLKIIDENSTASSFVKENRILLNETVTYNMLASFSVDISAPETGGKIKEWFILEYEDSSGNIYEMVGGMTNKEISVTTGVTARIISHNIPESIKNTSSPKQIELKLKNTSQSEKWTSRRAALFLRGESGVDSQFYDPKDWITKQIVGVPINKAYILPGEEGVIKFTINPKGVKPGTYTLVFSMELRDSGKKVYINGSEEFEIKIRVEK